MYSSYYTLTCETLGLSMEIFKYEYNLSRKNIKNNKPIHTLIVFRFCNICSRQSDFYTNRSPRPLLLALSVWNRTYHANRRKRCEQIARIFCATFWSNRDFTRLTRAIVCGEVLRTKISSFSSIESPKVSYMCTWHVYKMYHVISW